METIKEVYSSLVYSSKTMDDFFTLCKGLSLQELYELDSMVFYCATCDTWCPKYDEESDSTCKNCHTSTYSSMEE